jgi:RNA polymerase sigma factor (sigma-70 family)
VYAYVRLQWRQSPDEAADATQEFFARALEKNYFARYDAQRGLFRTYLRTCLEGFLSNERQAARRLKRGGGAPILSLDTAALDADLDQQISAPQESPEDRFHREWRRGLFAHAVDDLRAACAGTDRWLAFQCFAAYDLAGDPTTYQEVAARFGVTTVSVTNYIASMRRRLRQLLLERLRSVTSSDAEFRREARALFGGAP